MSFFDAGNIDNFCNFMVATSSVVVILECRYYLINHVPVYNLEVTGKMPCLMNTMPLFIPDSNLGIRRWLTSPRCVKMPPKRKAVANTEKAAKRARGETDLSDGLSWGEAGPATRGVRPLLHLTSDTLEGRDKVAGFDIDWTVIKTKSGRKFASGERWHEVRHQQAQEASTSAALLSYLCLLKTDYQSNITLFTIQFLTTH